MKRIFRTAVFMLGLTFLNGGLEKAAAETFDTKNKMIQKDVEIKLPETVKMGKYLQNGAEPEPVQWKVLGKENGKVLLLAENGLEALPFNKERKTVSWKESSIRQWLNEDFYDSAFSEAEKNSILGNEDKVFLLSTDEVEKYLSSLENRLCKPTALARKHGAYTNGEGCSAWWLRSSSGKYAQMDYLSSAGNFGSRTHYVDENILAVRPAIWVEDAFFKNLLKDR